MKTVYGAHHAHATHAPSPPLPLVPTWKKILCQNLRHVSPKTLLHFNLDWKLSKAFYLAGSYAKVMTIAAQFLSGFRCLFMCLCNGRNLKTLSVWPPCPFSILQIDPCLALWRSGYQLGDLYKLSSPKRILLTAAFLSDCTYMRSATGNSIPDEGFVVF